MPPSIWLKRTEVDMRALAKRRVKFAVLLALLGVQGCAGFVEFRTPKEFNGKKVIEDPPVTTQLLPGGLASC